MAPRAAEAARAARRRSILALVETAAITSQGELASLLRGRGFAVTQATVSRDIAELGLVKAARGDRHVYVTPRSLAGDAATGGAASGPLPAPHPASSRHPVPGEDRSSGLAAREPGVVPLPHPGTSRLRRIVADYPIRIARSGLSLVLVSTAGTASVIAQAIDESDLDDQVGTLAGDNTLLVLFSDEAALERWQAKFTAITTPAPARDPGEDLAGTYP